MRTIEMSIERAEEWEIPEKIRRPEASRDPDPGAASESRESACGSLLLGPASLQPEKAGPSSRCRRARPPALSVFLRRGARTCLTSMEAQRLGQQPVRVAQLITPLANRSQYALASQIYGTLSQLRAANQRIDYSPPTEVNRVRFPVDRSQIFAFGDHDKRFRGSTGFLGDLPLPLPAFRRCCIPSFGSRDLDVQSHPNFYILLRPFWSLFQTGDCNVLLTPTPRSNTADSTCQVISVTSVIVPLLLTTTDGDSSAGFAMSVKYLLAGLSNLNQELNVVDEDGMTYRIIVLIEDARKALE
ncbi:hypothetical protein PR048_006674 [Dryococelus australis]|uniref:Uncharacterized protein n=1 Tax=Dryococelus australis TaxID=614101 RepID=A0ABQ9IBL7_9NEOP|nr:hypothetical protein PR048_006674 [Dryococelus australis]